MIITADDLLSWNACDEGRQWFIDHFPAGEGDYQIILDALAADDQPGYAHWLMDHAGRDEAARPVVH